MPCHAFTDKLLLLACGQLIVSEVQIDRLLCADVTFSNDPPERFADEIAQRRKALGIDRLIPDDLDQDGDSLEQLPAEPESTPAAQTRPFAQEVVAARRIRREAIRQVATLMEQARCGQVLDLGPVRSTVRHVVSSLRCNHRAFASLLRLKSLDAYTYTHSLNNCVLSVLLAERTGLGPEAEIIGLGAVLHDIGKVRLPEDLLRKPAALTDCEWRLVKEHPAAGVEIAQLTGSAQEPAVAAISQHHERLNGTGYPAGLRDREVSLAGRIVAIADVYDAMTSDRPYHQAISPPQAMRSLFEQRGDFFDPHLARLFVEAVGLFPIGSLVRLSSGELGIVAEVNPQSIWRPTVLIVPGLCGAPQGALRLLDLSQTPPSGVGKEIVGMEDPTKFPVDVDDYLARAPELAEAEDIGLDLRA